MAITENYPADTLLNAKRLLEDSILLMKSERVESSLALGVLALEELGKYLILRWGVRNEASKRKNPTHIEKQSASFVILHAKEILDTSPKKSRRLMDGEDQRIRRWGPFSEQLQWAKAGFYEDMRMLATYSDLDKKWPLEIADDIEQFDPSELHTFFRQAMLASRNKKKMALAAEIYKNGLGDL